MKNSIRKICQNLYEGYDTETLDSTLESLSNEIRLNGNFFEKFTVSEKIEIIYGIFSLAKTGSFDWAENSLKTLHLVSVFNYLEDDFSTDNCEECGGSGSEDCSECDSKGYINCDFCEGEGTYKCNVCDGEGSLEEDGELVKCSACAGTGDVECDDCDGEGVLTCQNCNGNGTLDCGYCGGNGEVETDFLKYEIFDFFVFEKDLLRFMKDRGELLEPVGEFFDYFDNPKIPLSGKYILSLGLRNESGKFKPFVQPFKDYCFFIGPYNNEDIIWRGPKPSVITYPNQYLE